VRSGEERVEVAESSHAVEAAALSRFWEYQRQPRRTDPEDTADDVARDAYLAGFRAGARYAIHLTSALADPQFQAAVQFLADLSEEPIR
jgi:hypothetical protein